MNPSNDDVVSRIVRCVFLFLDFPDQMKEEGTLDVGKTPQKNLLENKKPLEMSFQHSQLFHPL